MAEENNPLNIHYDASKEVRAKGAGFYQFSGDEETRQKQMEELKKVREETEKTRQELGAVDLRPGGLEGIVAESKGVTVPQRSRALEKRKRELEERRRLLELKRRKKNHAAGTPEPSDEAPVFSMPPDTPEGEPEHPPESPQRQATQNTVDPFAALEARTASGPDQKGKGRQAINPVSDADAFLASLEQSIMVGRKSR